MPRHFILLILALPTVVLAPLRVRAAEPERPLMKDFMGLNVHTVQFKPDLYAPVCRLVRDYHPVRWDLAEDTSQPTKFPFAANRVDWGSMYAKWNKAGFEIDACLMFDDLPHDKWKDPARDAKAYGESFARFFGPAGKNLCTSVEIGNEPAKYSEAQYRALFQNMAGGVRAAAPKLKIATCAVMTGKPDQWSKPMSAIAGLEGLYDVLNVHTYPFKDKWPTWRRSYPEDESIRFLKDVGDLLKWRDEHAKGKQVWVTEFGYDSTTKQPDPKGNFAKWVGVSDADQARYLVRCYLMFSSLRIDRAYLYFFNDKDEPQLHGASGLTREFQPKPSFHAVAHLYSTLGDYRFVRAVERKDGDVFCFEYQHATKPEERIYVAWIGSDKAVAERRVVHIGPGHKVQRVERMPMQEGKTATVDCKMVADGIELSVGGDPVYVFVK